MLPVKPPEKFLVKIAELIGDGVSAVSRPWLYRRDTINKALVDADALRIEKLSMMSLRHDMREVRRGNLKIGPNYNLIAANGAEASSGDILAVETAKQQFLQSLEAQGINPKNFIEVERQINLNQIDIALVEEAQNDASAVADESNTDPDWFAQWRNRAQDLSNVEMQRLWAKVRLGEAKSKGAFSIHAMELLSRLSRSDADMIATLGDFVINGRFVAKEAREILLSAGLGVDQLLDLQNMGVLTSVELIGGVTMPINYSSNFKGQPCALIRSHQSAIVLCAPKQNGGAASALPVAVLTSAGRQLLTLASNEANADYLKFIADRMRPSVEAIYLGSVVGGEGDEFEVSDLTPF